MALDVVPPSSVQERPHQRGKEKFYLSVIIIGNEVTWNRQRHVEVFNFLFFPPNHPNFDVFLHFSPFACCQVEGNAPVVLMDITSTSTSSDTANRSPMPSSCLQCPLDGVNGTTSEEKGHPERRCLALSTPSHQRWVLMHSKWIY